MNFNSLASQEHPCLDCAGQTYLSSQFFSSSDLLISPCDYKQCVASVRLHHH
jgi:hypothetical protein